jgi:arsenite methyltransferase
VIDLGCGFGVDSQIAAYKVGSNGKVIGVDISAKEIKIAKENSSNF